jgi:hypothetical protein
MGTSNSSLLLTHHLYINSNEHHLWSLELPDHGGVGFRKFHPTHTPLSSILLLTITDSVPIAKDVYRPCEFVWLAYC